MSFMFAYNFQLIYALNYCDYVLIDLNMSNMRTKQILILEIKVNIC